MLKFLPVLVLLPLLSFADALEKDWDLTISTKGSVGPDKSFESQGAASYQRLNSYLKTSGGYSSLYRKYQASKDRPVTDGAWQEAEAFNEYLKKSEIAVPTELLAMRLGMDQIFASKDDEAVKNINQDLGAKLTFEQKIEFAAQLGGILLDGYDYDRTGSGPAFDGVVTFRQMIEARQDAKKAGVCRDMSQAMAQTLKEMGVEEAYVVTYQNAGGGHATVLVQDPKNKNKTYNINYDEMTTMESASSLSHLKQDSSIPSVGTTMQIYDAEGKHITSLPTHLGVALHEMLGGNASDLDPMLRSENSIGSVNITNQNGFASGIHGGFTPDGDQIMAMSAGIQSDNQIFPNKFGLVVYSNKRDTNQWGEMNTYGVLIEASQTVQTPVLKVMTSNGNKISMQVKGTITSRGNGSYTDLEKSFSDNKINWYPDFSTNVGSEMNYVTKNDNTQVKGSIYVTGDIAKSDVRDENSQTLDYRDVTTSLYVSHKISSHLQGFAGATITARPVFGVQSRQEVGIMVDRKNSQVSVMFGHQGQVGGDAPVFVPGSKETYYFAAKYKRGKNWEAGISGQCAGKTKDECAVFVQANLKH